MNGCITWSASAHQHMTRGCSALWSGLMRQRRCAMPEGKALRRSANGDEPSPNRQGVSDDESVHETPEPSPAMQPAHRCFPLCCTSVWQAVPARATRLSTAAEAPHSYHAGLLGIQNSCSSQLHISAVTLEAFFHR